MCLGEVGRVIRLLDERTAVVECTGREVTAALDVVLAEGGVVGAGDVVIVSMGFVLAITDESELAAGAGPSDREEVWR
ncbi:MAG TPA: HypC/HybG/HupF family hydrogenase formation chaperone [Ilumatobacteraceae bacterium]|nr:HypC/HybG/HupF family hydrogenase formation chaperone [Ilumatobacteraceae bacterium]